MSPPPPLDPRAITADLRRAITSALAAGDKGADNPALQGLLKKIEERAVEMADTAPPLDGEPLSPLSAKMGKDLDQLEDLLEALTLTAGSARGA